jgi:hypothetical protein
VLYRSFRLNQALLLVWILMWFAARSEAQPILLGAIELNAGFGASGVASTVPPGFPFTGVGISLGYSLNTPSSFGSPCIGCQLILGLGEVGQFDFDSSNSADFNAFASLMTDGVNQTLWTIGGFYPGPLLSEGQAVWNRTVCVAHRT